MKQAFDSQKGQGLRFMLKDGETAIVRFFGDFEGNQDPVIGTIHYVKRLPAGKQYNSCSKNVSDDTPCVFCLMPNTPVLGADLAWRPISDVKEGDTLVGFDEEPNNFKATRQLQPATVEAVRWSKQPTLRIITNKREIVTTGNHGWLIRQAQEVRAEGYIWKPANRLRVGENLSFFDEPYAVPAVTDDYKLGYLNGMTLGDGTFCYEPGKSTGYTPAYWRVALTDEEPLGRLVAYLASFGVELNIRPFYEGIEGKHQPLKKVETRALGSLDIINDLLRYPHASPNYMRGWLAGFFDAEGSHSFGVLRYTQKDLKPLETVVQYAASLGTEFCIEPCHDRSASTARLVGSYKNRMRFLGQIQPALTRKTTDWISRSIRAEREEITAIEKCGFKLVVDIQTSTATFMANGVATHNCYEKSKGDKGIGAGVRAYFQVKDFRKYHGLEQEVRVLKPGIELRPGKMPRAEDFVMTKYPSCRAPNRVCEFCRGGSEAKVSGFRHWELSTTYAEQLIGQQTSLRNFCKCGAIDEDGVSGTIQVMQYLCSECNSPVEFYPERGIPLAGCAACGKSLPPLEEVACTACENPQRCDIPDFLFRVKRTGGGTDTAYNFEAILPCKLPSEEELAEAEKEKPDWEAMLAPLPPEMQASLLGLPNSPFQTPGHGASTYAAPAAKTPPRPAQQAPRADKRVDVGALLRSKPQPPKPAPVPAKAANKPVFKLKKPTSLSTPFDAVDDDSSLVGE
jgi:hypothetical protein